MPISIKAYRLKWKVLHTIIFFFHHKYSNVKILLSIYIIKVKVSLRTNLDGVIFVIARSKKERSTNSCLYLLFLFVCGALDLSFYSKPKGKLRREESPIGSIFSFLFLWIEFQIFCIAESVYQIDKFARFNDSPSNNCWDLHCPRSWKSPICTKDEAVGTDNYQFIFILGKPGSESYSIWKGKAD